MSVTDRRRLVAFEQVKQGQLTQQEAAERLGLSARQVRRLYQRWLAEGDAGLPHRLRGRPGNHRGDPQQREQVLSLYRQHYSGFGPTLACEHLQEDHALALDHDTLRRWLKDEGLWTAQRKSRAKRRRRPRRCCFGELVQIDGSHHLWFEDRATRAVLMVMIDDATGYILARFFEAETTFAAMTIFALWSRTFGVPVQLYPDQDSIYRVNTKAADELEARTGKRPATQFGRAMSELGVKLTCAKTPQAKGRVERANRTLQDRLVKALRLAGISDIAAANRFLQEQFLSKLNARFTVEPVQQADAHLPVDEPALQAALCLKHSRSVTNDQCLTVEGKILQLLPTAKQPSLAGKRVEVREHLDGSMSVHWQNHPLAFQLLPNAPQKSEPQPPLAQRVAGHKPQAKPALNHPWRRG